MCLKQKGRSGSTCWWFGIHLPPARYPKPATDHARAAVDSTAGAIVRRINTLILLRTGAGGSGAQCTTCRGGDDPKPKAPMIEKRKEPPRIKI